MLCVLKPYFNQKGHFRRFVVSVFDQSYIDERENERFFSVQGWALQFLQFLMIKVTPISRNLGFLHKSRITNNLKKSPHKTIQELPKNCFDMSPSNLNIEIVLITPYLIIAPLCCERISFQMNLTAVTKHVIGKNP